MVIRVAPLLLMGLKTSAHSVLNFETEYEGRAGASTDDWPMQG
jgi:hypothetical protein